MICIIMHKSQPVMKKYKYKLNMLEPGYMMIKIIFLLGIIGLVFYLLEVTLLYFICWSLAILFGIILMILLIIEGHQDKVLNEQAILQNKEDGEL